MGVINRVLIEGQSRHYTCMRRTFTLNRRLKSLSGENFSKLYHIEHERIREMKRCPASRMAAESQFLREEVYVFKIMAVGWKT
jgi:hypothetical protein